MNAYTNKTDRALDRAWKKAAAAGNAEVIENLRAAFEGLYRVDVRLTERQVERLEDEHFEGGGFTILGKSRVIFHDYEDALCAAERLEGAEDDAVDRAMQDQITDVTWAQEQFIERQVRASMKVLVRKLRAAARQVATRYGMAA